MVARPRRAVTSQPEPVAFSHRRRMRPKGILGAVFGTQRTVIGRSGAAGAVWTSAPLAQAGIGRRAIRSSGRGVLGR